MLGVEAIGHVKGVKAGIIEVTALRSSTLERQHIVDEDLGLKALSRRFITRL